MLHDSILQDFLNELSDSIAQKVEARLFIKQPSPDPVPQDEIIHGDKALAKFLKTSPQTIWKLKREGVLPVHRMGRKYFYYASEIKSESFQDRKFSNIKKGSRIK